MKLIVTIHEETLEAALDAIGALDAPYDGIELRAERLGDVDLAALRASTPKPLILTHRGQTVGEALIRAATEAGIDLVDVEWRESLDRDLVRRYADRIVLSHHDYESTPDVDAILRALLSFGAAHTKLAVTPRSFRDNQRILETMRQRQGAVTMIGMGGPGLYSRILTPFFGSELQFVAPSGHRTAAPGQLTLSQAQAIYGTAQRLTAPRHLFTLVGNPASHSLSPTIHNPLFRERGVAAAYAIFETDSLDDILQPFEARENDAPSGLSITAPFKEAAFAFAVARGAAIAPNARQSGAVNTLVRIGESGIVADNTDVDGFATLLAQVCGRDRKSVALIGAGGTARAALVALHREGMHVTLFNRTLDKARALHPNAAPLDDLARFDGEIVINTMTSGVDLEITLKPGMTYIEAGYGASEPERPGIQHFTGLDLLHAQAIRQNERFMRVFDESR
jgi:3-dehydroquinate dehydratase/shikimate dehydrogenase